MLSLASIAISCDQRAAARTLLDVSAIRVVAVSCYVPVINELQHARPMMYSL
jgi:hypothetical protein